MTTEPVDTDVARMKRALLGADYSPALPEIEYYLDHGMLWLLWGRYGGRYWRLRRNGRTQRWQRDATRFRIPVKAGLRETGAITEDTVVGVTCGIKFLISEGDPNPTKKRHFTN